MTLPRNNGEVRCFQKTEKAEVEMPHKNIESETKRFMENIKNPFNSFVFQT